MRLQRVWTMLAVVAALLAVVATPALPHPGQGGPLTEEGDLDARHHLEEIGFHELLGNGFNTDVWAWASGDRLFATSGTWGTLTGSADTGEECPSETDDPSNPSKSGVKIVEATDPANPELVAKIGTVNGSTNNDIKVLTGVSTDAFEGDILAHSLEPCGVNLGHALVPGADEPPKPQTGFELYDVSDPTAPAHLGTYNNGGFGTHNLYLFDRPDLGKAYSATVFNDGDLSESDYVGFVQIVDITDPTSPAMVAQWSLADAESQGGPTFEELCQIRGSHFPSCNLHDVWVSDDGTLLYASYWDAGLVLLDISEPAAPQFIGQIQPGGTDNEGNTHVAVPYHLDGKHYVIVGDEDFIGPGPVPHVIVNETPDGAAISSGEQFPGTEQSDTRRLSEVAPLGPGAALEADGPDVCTFSTAAGVATAEQLDPWFGVIQRGTCPFQTMVSNAEAAGADGVIIVNNEAGRTSGLAAGNIPALMIEQEPGERLMEATSPTSSDVKVTLGLLPAEDINPWGFVRIVDVTDLDDPSTWKQVSTFKAPFVDTFEGQGPDNVYSAHNPLVGPDGRIYVAWYTDGVRVLEPSGDASIFEETDWFVPLPEDHEDDNDTDPHGTFPANEGFWGSMAIEHPVSGDLLVFNTDVNRGLYILGYPDETAGGSTDDDATVDDGTLAATGGGAALVGTVLLGLAFGAARRRRD